SLDSVTDRILGPGEGDGSVKIHSSHRAGFSGAEANYQNGMSGEMTAIGLELSRRHQIRSQLNNPQVRKKLLPGEGGGELMKQNRHGKKYRDFLAREPIGEPGHASLSDIEGAKCRAIEQGGKGNLQALADAARIEQSQAIVRADMQAVAVKQALVQQIGVRLHNSFGLPGGARCVNQKRQILRRDGQPQIVARTAPA